jgi:hypothetical protein
MAVWDRMVLLLTQFMPSWQYYIFSVKEFFPGVFNCRRYVTKFHLIFFFSKQWSTFYKTNQTLTKYIDMIRRIDLVWVFANNIWRDIWGSHTSVKMTVLLFWIVTLLGLVSRCHCFWETDCLHLQPWRLRWYVHPECFYLPTSPCGITTCMNIIIKRRCVGVWSFLSTVAQGVQGLRILYASVLWLPNTQGSEDGTLSVGPAGSCWRLCLSLMYCGIISN